MLSPKYNAFDHLHPGLQRWAWEKGWRGLRDIQEQALPVVLGREQDVIIAAPTAGGKTEAAFLPAVTFLAGNPQGLCVAICPLKALINDQYGRLSEIGEAAGVRVTAWHGDISQSAKRKFLASPAGVLLITPESLEALLVRRGAQVMGMAANLKYLVVDELHAFIGNERGKQLQSLMHRLELHAGTFVPRIALSATLGDMRLAGRFLRPNAARAPVCIEGVGAGREVRVVQKGFRRKPPVVPPTAGPKQKLGGVHDVCDELFHLLRGSDNLVFANSRGKVEAVVDLLGRQSESLGVPREFFPHHGSLSKASREHAERALKSADTPATVVATTTLEMGIDVGSVQSVAQIGNSPSVSSLQQRLGRSGRAEGEVAVLRLFIEEMDVPGDNAQDALRAQTVQSIAMVELMRDGWLEPPDVRSLNLSTLIQQLLSLLAQFGGIRAEEAWRILCHGGPFEGVTQQLFSDLLQSLGQADLLAQGADGRLVLGPGGEKLVDHYEFYAAFTTPDELRVVNNGKTLGMLPGTKPILQGSCIILAGQRWRVTDVNRKKRVVFVCPSSGGRPPMFDGGAALVHDGVRRRMRDVYASALVPEYLDKVAAELLEEGREAFFNYRLDQYNFINHGDWCQFFPWCGDRVLSTLELLLRGCGLDVTNEGINLLIQSPVETVVQRISALLGAGLPSGEQLALRVSNKKVGKYDECLPDALLRMNYASACLDVAGAERVLRGVLRGSLS